MVTAVRFMSMGMRVAIYRPVTMAMTVVDGATVDNSTDDAANNTTDGIARANALLGQTINGDGSSPLILRDLGHITGWAGLSKGRAAGRRRTDVQAALC